MRLLTDKLFGDYFQDFSLAGLVYLVLRGAGLDRSSFAGSQLLSPGHDQFALSYALFRYDSADDLYY